MIYTNVAEIYQALDESHARFTESVAELSEGHQEFQPSPEHWSIAQIAEHVSIVEGHIAKLTGMLLHKAASEGALLPESDGSIAPVSIEDFVARSLKEKYQAPETAVPRGGVRIADSLDKLERAQQTFRELRPRIQTTDGARVNYPHPVFGPLNLYQWLVMVSVHLDRHARQIESLKETMKAEDGSVN